MVIRRTGCRTRGARREKCATGWHAGGYSQGNEPERIEGSKYRDPRPGGTPSACALRAGSGNMRLHDKAQHSPWLPDSPSRPVAPIAPAIPGAAPESWLVEYGVGLKSLPYLAGHGFHDMVVLPGAFHVALVRRIHRDLFHRDAVSLRHIEFRKPVILADEDAPITVRIERRDDGSVAYELFESGSDAALNAHAEACARMQVDAGPATTADDNTSVASGTEGLSDHAAPALTSGDFYSQSRGNGNQYGPHFQTLSDIRRSGLDLAGRFADAEGSLTPPLLDAPSQLLSAFTLDRGRTFILQSIERLIVGALPALAPVSAIATVTGGNDARDAGLVGSVRMVDADGKCLADFSGIRLAFMDRPASSEPAPPEEIRLSVASTFTAEPLEESLRFWARHFGRDARVAFAPYNQVFQQLLDPASAFRQNRDAVNLIVLGLDDWLHGDRSTLAPIDPARASDCFGSRQRHVLLNGLEIVHLNRYETDYVFQEIFGDESYLRHGIRLEDGDTVVDIGANIGLFSLFVLSRCKNPTIFAYEPSPRVFDLLQANCAAYGDPSRVRAFNFGVAEKKGSGRFTFYERSSVFSSFHPDEREDRAAVQAVARNVLQHEQPGDVLETDVEDLTADRLAAETIECRLTSVSDIIRENGIARIHLLKIDAEKSEAGILRGIEEEHWPLIEQLVIEVHDRSRAAVQSIEEQLIRRGYRCAVVEERLLEQSGLFNVYATRRAPSAVSAEAPEKGLQRKVREFCTALDGFAASAPNPLVLAVAPHSRRDADAALAAAEQEVLARAARHPQIHAVSSQEILARHPVRQLHDPHSRQLGHMPFTQEGYAAIGTALSRAVFSMGAPPVKVIVLDCDNTLWQGLCAEDGPAGIIVTPAFRRLQQFMIGQMRAGVLLTLCSKNQESDVMAVFDQRDDMLLRREHLAAWRINWEPKPDNLRSLAAQLGLGLDSFVFLDDNPVECAAVRASCPEVIALQLPQENDRIPAFLESLWIFDRATATREDRERSHWYQTNTEREGLRAAAPTLRDFLDGLQLRIQVAEAKDDQLARVAQLTVRTNQFNLTAIRRSEREIRELIESGAKCLVTSVSDRFGDYGLVGTILYTAAADRYIVDTLLLSCRALGKGVEHRMVAELAGRALRDGKSIIAIPFCRTDRNEPAREFIAKLGSAPSGAEYTLELPVTALAALRYEPADRTAEANGEKSGTVQADARASRSGFGRAKLSAALQRLGDEFHAIDDVVAAIESSRIENQPTASLSGPETMEGASTLEQSLAVIWKRALGRARIGFGENFFDVGGTSLKAVVVVAMIRKELKMNVSIISLFECPTIRLLAAKLDGSGDTKDEVSTAGVAESRGRQRRNKLIKRKVA